MIVFGLLPIATLILIWLGLSLGGWRNAFIHAGVVWGVLVLVGTEGLSQIGQLRFVPLVLFWSVGAAIAAAFIRKSSGWIQIPHIKSVVTIRTLPLIGVAATTLLVALVAPPNTFDSMTYHLARVAHWVYQGSVKNYPTETLRQLYQPPWTEFAITHLQILTDGDRLSNLIEWLCMFGSLIGVSVIARELGASAYGQHLAAMIAATLPMGIVQASSTQTDYVEAFWMVCAVYYTLRIRNQGTLANTLALGASIGLALLTKGTGYIYVIPIATMAGWWLVQDKRAGIWKPIVVLGAIILIINAGAWVRNISTFGSIFGPPSPVTNQVFSAQALTSNIIRDASVQIGTSSPRINREIARAIFGLHRLLRMDLNDPRTTWPSSQFKINPLTPDEDSTPNPIHVVLLVLASIISLTHFKRLRPYAIYLSGLLVAFLLFAFVLRWQPWHSRLELPLLVLAAPLTAGVFSMVWSQRVATAITVVLLISAIPWLLGPRTRPLIGPRSILVNPRSAIYFYAWPHARASYLEIADQAHLARCRVVGIDGSENSWEYPLWVYLSKDSRVVPVNPAPATEHLREIDVHPCLVFAPPVP